MLSLFGAWKSGGMEGVKQQVLKRPFEEDIPLSASPTGCTESSEPPKKKKKTWNGNNPRKAAALPGRQEIRDRMLAEPRPLLEGDVARPVRKAEWTNFLEELPLSDGSTSLRCPLCDTHPSKIRTHMWEKHCLKIQDIHTTLGLEIRGSKSSSKLRYIPGWVEGEGS